MGRPLGECKQCLGLLDEEGDCHACETCPRCKGDGSVERIDLVEVRKYDEVCPLCDGWGWVGANGNPARRL
jgi:DnaJ-class molecular chaperone